MKSGDICIVGKGNSLLDKKLGNNIDSHDIIIRVNNLPTELNKEQIGSTVSVISSRCKIKLKNLINDPFLKLSNPNVWVCSEMREYYTEFNCSLFEFMTKSEVNNISNLFPNFLKLNLHRYDKSRGFFMPDTGITTILLTSLRFPNKKIDVCGFDMYKKGNVNLYESKSNSSLFLTPVLQQMLVYNHLIKSDIIRELK